ncbi:MAG: hypothetical protein PHS92_02910 [Candidatus Gracilibacteria bacterium]|nr:hypothetical protein [Candidatus Gracilibacteria bacterium]
MKTAKIFSENSNFQFNTIEQKELTDNIYDILDAEYRRLLIIHSLLVSMLECKK